MSDGTVRRRLQANSLGTRQRLRDGAAVRRIFESELARRYVTEGVRLDRHPRITFTEHPSGRRAALRSRPRLDVRIIVEAWREHARDEGAVAAAYALDLADVRAALDYYHEQAAWIDEEGRRARADADRLEAEWLAARS